MKKSKKLFLVLVSICLTLTFNLNVLAASNSVLEEGRNIIKDNYISPVSQEVLQKDSLDEIVKALNDPFSEYFTKEQYEDFMGLVNNTFVGIGVQVEAATEGIKINSTIYDSPAYKIGLKSGDIITEADGKSLKGLSVEEGTKLIKGEAGTSVSLVVKRGDKLLNYTVERKEIVSATVESKMVDNTAYMVVTTFGENTASEFKTELTKMQKLNPQSYIIDLRYNGGGLLTTALDLAGYFIGNSSAIQIENKTGSKVSLSAESNNSMRINKPVIFLTNEYTASASEILSGAVRDYNKATFVGNTTYGKGVAQNMFPLSDGSYLKLTTMKFYSPKGNVIQKVGISPDLKVIDSSTIDSLNVAEVMLSGTGEPKNKLGYVKIKINKKYGTSTFYLNLAKVRTSEKYSSLMYILNNVSKSDVQIGSLKGWNAAASSYYNDKSKIILSDYIIPSSTIKESKDKSFTFYNGSYVNDTDIKKNCIKIMDCETGKVINVKYQKLSGKKLKLTPKEKLNTNTVYHIVINKPVKGYRGEALRAVSY